MLKYSAPSKVSNPRNSIAEIRLKERACRRPLSPKIARASRLSQVGNFEARATVYKSMIVTTSNDLASYKIVHQLGVLRGLTVRSRSVLGNIGIVVPNSSCVMLLESRGSMLHSFNVANGSSRECHNPRLVYCLVFSLYNLCQAPMIVSNLFLVRAKLLPKQMVQRTTYQNKGLAFLA